MSPVTCNRDSHLVFALEPVKEFDHVRLIKTLEHVHLVFDNLIVSTKDALADHLDCYVDGWIRCLPCCLSNNAECTFSERLFEIVLLLLDVGIWLLCQRIVEWHCGGSKLLYCTKPD